MRRLVFFCICYFPLILLAQRWAIRPELCLTAAKAKFVSNTNPYQPFKATYSNNPDISINIDYYLKENNDRFTLSFGTFQQSFTMTGMEVKKKGYLGFIAPEFFLSEGTPFSGSASFSYAKNIAKKVRKNSVFILGGFQYYFLGPSHIGGAAGPFGSFVLYDTDMKRETTGNFGWHAGINGLFKNRKDREILQLSFKYLGTFNTTQFTNDYFYSMITPTEPPEILKDQVLRYRLTGAGIQLGISKTLIYFPGQRKMKKG
jgi:hypothetical protein